MSDFIKVYSGITQICLGRILEMINGERYGKTLSWPILRLIPKAIKIIVEIHGKVNLSQNEVQNEASRGGHHTTATCSTNKSTHIHLHLQPTAFYDILIKFCQSRITRRNMSVQTVTNFPLCQYQIFLYITLLRLLLVLQEMAKSG